MFLLCKQMLLLVSSCDHIVLFSSRQVFSCNGIVAHWETLSYFWPRSLRYSFYWAPGAWDRKLALVSSLILVWIRLISAHLMPLSGSLRIVLCRLVGGRHIHYRGACCLADTPRLLCVLLGCFDRMTFGGQGSFAKSAVLMECISIV